MRRESDAHFTVSSVCVSAVSSDQFASDDEQVEGKPRALKADAHENCDQQKEDSANQEMSSNG